MKYKKLLSIKNLFRQKIKIIFEKYSNNTIKWKNEILKSFYISYTNRFIESLNNKINFFKRNAYRYANFKRFINIILYMCKNKNIEIS